MRENVCSKQFFYKSDKLALSVCGSAVSISPSDRQDRRSYAKIDLFIAESPSLVQGGCTTGHKTWYSHGNSNAALYTIRRPRARIHKPRLLSQLQSYTDMCVITSKL